MNGSGSSLGETGQAPFATHKPLALVLTGVLGSGKSEVGWEVAKGLGLRFPDADDFHSAANRLHAFPCLYAPGAVRAYRRSGASGEVAKHVAADP
jgi:hypothetical protein